MTDHADRALVEAIKRREARNYCRVCGYKLDPERFCNFCGRVNPSSNRRQPDMPSGRSGLAPEGTKDTQ